MITMNRINPAAPALRASSPEKPAAPEPAEPQTHDTLQAIGSAATGFVSGLGSTMSKVVLGACAGGAQGLVHGAGLSEDQSAMAFKVSLGANLAVAGAIAGAQGVQMAASAALTPAQAALAGAVTNVVMGQGEWANSTAGFKAQVCYNSNQFVDQAMTNMPEAVAHGGSPWARAARGGVGEVVGAVAGAYTAAIAAPTFFQEGYNTGAHFFDQTVDQVKSYFSDAPEQRS